MPDIITLAPLHAHKSRNSTIKLTFALYLLACLLPAPATLTNLTSEQKGTTLISALSTIFISVVLHYYYDDDDD